MHNIILDGISEVINDNRGLLRIALRQKAKFEGWLKFELAYYLEKQGLGPVYVESGVTNSSKRSDITFFYDNEIISIELKTPNASWKINGIENKTRPITSNFTSIINDSKKHKSGTCIIAFVLFPIPSKDSSWVAYINRIITETGIEIDRNTNCRLIEMDINDSDKCEVLICTFISKQLAGIL